MLEELSAQVGEHHNSDLFLAQNFAALGDEGRALDFIARARVSDPDDWQVLTLEAQIHRDAGRHRESIASAMQSLSLVYFQPRLHYSMGLSLRRLGDDLQAAEEFQTALSQLPDLTGAHDELAKILMQLPGGIGQASLHILMAQNLRRRATLGLPTPRVATVLETPAFPVFTQSAVGAPADRSRVVTVVTGLPRSGTSMMMQMLEAAGIHAFTDGKRLPYADNPRGYYESEKAIGIHMDHTWIPEARGKAVKFVAQLLPHLPDGEEYRLVFLQRDLEEVVASQRVMLSRMGQGGAALSDSQLMRAYSQQLIRVRNWLRERPGINVLPVNYEDAVDNPAELAERLAEFLGKPFDRRKAASAVDGALQRQRRQASNPRG